MLSIEPIHAFSDNYIWLLTRPGSRECAVVDPGDAAPVMTLLAERGLQLDTILVTHHHFDHVGGIAGLLESAGAVRVIGPHNPAIDSLTERVAAGDRVEVLGCPFEVLEVPGHTLDHIAFFHAPQSAADNPVLFCGDTLFAGGCGRVFEGTHAQMHQSLARLAALPDATRIYCAHEYTQSNLRFAQAADPDNPALSRRVGEAAALRARQQPTVPSTLAEERATNPFLRCEEHALVEGLRRQGKWQGDHPEAVFAALRSWKDAF